jgi:hypothetical protein
MWLLAEIVMRFASWVVARLSRDMENDEWEHGSRFPLPPGPGDSSSIVDE